MSDAHAISHQTATEAWRGALPYTQRYYAYAHVFGHHGDGGRMGSHPLTDPIFTWCMSLYRLLHNDVFGLHAQMGSPQQYLFVVVFDGAVTAVMIFVGLLFLHVYGSCIDAALSVVRRVTGGGAEDKKEKIQ